MNIASLIEWGNTVRRSRGDWYALSDVETTIDGVKVTRLSEDHLDGVMYIKGPYDEAPFVYVHNATVYVGCIRESTSTKGRAKRFAFYSSASWQSSDVSTTAQALQEVVTSTQLSELFDVVDELREVAYDASPKLVDRTRGGRYELFIVSLQRGCEKPDIKQILKDLKLYSGNPTIHPLSAKGDGRRMFQIKSWID